MTMGVPIGGGTLPTDEAAPLLRLPAHLRGDVAPIRDAVLAAERAFWQEWERQAEYAAAQSSILRSEGIFLDEDGAERGFVRQGGESDATFRARILAGTDTVTPVAICAATDRILSAYTTKTSKYAERLDGVFPVPRGGSAAFRSYAFARNGVSRTPTYPDRLYADDAASNGGYQIARRAPQGAVPFQRAGLCRQFILRIPSLAFVDAAGSFVQRRAAVVPTALLDARTFPGARGVAGQARAYVRPRAASSLQIYQAIVNSVDRIKGAGIRWCLVVDPYL